MVRRLRSLVEECIGEELRKLCQDRGGYRYDPVGLFSVWMYGLTQGEVSSRKLEENCRYDVRYSFLCSGTRPDHTTLSRFRDVLSDVLDSLMERLARKAREEGLLGARAVAVDGTKVPAVSTQWRKALDRTKEADAAFLTKPNGDRLFGFNVQAATDIESGYVAGFAATAETTDFTAAEAILSAVERQSGALPSAVVADTGYDGPECHEAFEERGIVAFVAQLPRRGHPFPVDEHGTPRCPAGHEPKRRIGVDHGRIVEIFQVSRCASCPLKAGCGVSGRQKKTVVPYGTTMPQTLARKERAESPDGRMLLRARGPSVERLFASLKSQMGLRRFKLRNFKGAQLEFGLGVLAYNIRMLLKSLNELFGPRIALQLIYRALQTPGKLPQTRFAPT
jgi:transposase